MEWNGMDPKDDLRDSGKVIMANWKWKRVVNEHSTTITVDIHRYTHCLRL